MSDEAVDEKLERYVPTHPLPSEIRSMRRDSTICKYCGVSYLIHNEIKSLEKKLQECEKELTHLKGCDLREKELREKFSIAEENLKEELSRREKILHNLKSELRDEQAKATSAEREKAHLIQNLNSSQTKTEHLMFQLQKHVAQVQSCHKNVQDIRQQNASLRESIISYKTYVSACCNDLIDKTATCFGNRISDLSKQNEEFKAEKSEHLMQLKQHQQSNESLMAEISVIENKRIKMDTTIHDLERMLKENDANLSQVKENNQILNLQCLDYQKIIKDKAAELDDTKKNVDKKVSDLEQCVNQGKDTIAQQSNEIRRLKSQIDEWKEKFDQKDELHSESIRRNSFITTEISDLKQKLDTASMEITALKKDREISIEAHQNQITDLRNSFKKKINDMQGWPEKLEEALNEQRKKHIIDVDSIKAKLQSSNQQEILILQSKHDQLIKKYTSDLTSNSNQHQSELTNLQSRVAAVEDHWKTLFNNAQQKSQVTESTLKQEIDRLVNLIKNLEENIVTLESQNSEHSSVTSQSYLELQQKFSSLSIDHDNSEKELATAKDEVVSLQETVRKECEERLELTSALSEARQELLRFQGVPDSRTKDIDSVSISTTSPGEVSLRISTMSTTLPSHTQISPESALPSVSNRTLPMGKINGGTNIRTSTNYCVTNRNFSNSPRANNTVRNEFVHKDPLSSDIEVTVGRGKVTEKAKQSSLTHNRKRLANLLNPR